VRRSFGTPLRGRAPQDHTLEGDVVLHIVEFAGRLFAGAAVDRGSAARGSGGASRGSPAPEREPSIFISVAMISVV
jgi:hypothetical protein